MCRDISYKRKTGKRKVACPENQWGVDDDEIPRNLGFMGGDKLPRGLLCQSLRGQVDRYGPCFRAFRLHRLYGGIIPVAFVENTRHRGIFANRRNRRGEDHTLQSAAMFQGRVQDRCGSSQGRDDEIWMDMS